MTTVRIPKTFFIDHKERDLPTPKILNEYEFQYVIDNKDPALGDLISDAEFYADSRSTGSNAFLRNAAKALLKVLAP